MRLSPEQITVVGEAVRAARGRPEVAEAIRGVYAAVEGEIAQRRPVCSVSGRCCRFEEYGHLLYVTTAELAAFASQLPRPINPADIGQGCLYQVEGLCTAHAIRPFGCRIYFCDATAQAWQEAQYEQFHLRLRQLHETLQIPYFYVEWRQGLRAIATAGEAGAELTGLDNPLSE